MFIIAKHLTDLVLFFCILFLVRLILDAVKLNNYNNNINVADLI